MKNHHEFDDTQDCMIGRDPRTMSLSELEALGRPEAMPSAQTVSSALGATLPKSDAAPC
jgi:hypothetical protein